jgi:hypothetical protein
MDRVSWSLTPWTVPVADRCSATNRQGAQCGRPAIPGGTVCRNHGGAAPQVVAGAARRLAVAKVEADAAAFLGQVGLEPVEDPVAEIGRLAAGFLATAEAAAARVNALGERIRDTDAKGAEQLRAEVGVMERAGDRALRALDIQARHLRARDGDPDGVVERVVSGLTEVLTRAAQRQADKRAAGAA